MKVTNDNEENEALQNKDLQEDKDVLSQEDLQNGIKNFSEGERKHPLLETPEGKNNGAEPAVFRNQQKYHP